jgi:hypothetical protein
VIDAAAFDYAAVMGYTVGARSNGHNRRGRSVADSSISIAPNSKTLEPAFREFAFIGKLSGATTSANVRAS